MRSLSMLLLGAVALFGTAGCAKAQDKPAPDTATQGLPAWRQRMQQNNKPEQSIEQQVARLTKDMELTAEQQTKVRQLAWVHHDKIQKILDTAPPTLTRDDFTTQVHAISAEFHDAVDSLLTPHQLELRKAMVGRLDSGSERRRAP